MNRAPINWNNVIIWLAMLAVCGYVIWAVIHPEWLLRLLGAE